MLDVTALFILFNDLRNRLLNKNTIANIRLLQLQGDDEVFQYVLYVQNFLLI
jgi:hypothetical protein